MVAIAGLIRDKNIGVYVLANRDHIEVRHALMYRAFDLLSGGETPDWSTELKALYDGLAAQGEKARAEALAARVEGTSPSLPVSAYPGRYADPLFGEVLITETPSGLHADVGPGQPGAMEHWNYDTFRIWFDARWRGWRLATFRLGPDGTVASVQIGDVELQRRR
jgi:hypothetical protein